MTARLWASLACVACLLGACASEEPAWVAVVEAAHSRADGAQSAGERSEASVRLIEAYRTVPEAGGPLVAWVRQDLCARIGQGFLEERQPAQALEWARRGLSLSDATNVARADLLRLSGEALEALGDEEAAAAALHEALKVNQELMERALRGEATEKERP